MRYFTISAVLLLLTIPAFGAERTIDLTGWAAWVDPNSSGTFSTNNPDSPFDINFDGKLGYGAAVNVFFSDRLSTELSAVRVKSPVTIVGRNRIVNVSQDVDMYPITGTLQWHFAPTATIDPYIGAGAAYVVFSNPGQSLNNVRFRNIDSGDLGLVINGGVGIGFSRNLALVLDGKYVPVGSSAKGELVTGERTNFDVNPVILSAGLSIRF